MLNNFLSQLNGGGNSYTSMFPDWIRQVPGLGGLMAPHFEATQNVGQSPGGLMTDFNMLARQLAGVNQSPAVVPGLQPNSISSPGSVVSSGNAVRMSAPYTPPAAPWAGAKPQDSGYWQELEAMQRRAAANMGVRG
jgi:hypothetical protein